MANKNSDNTKSKQTYRDLQRENNKQFVNPANSIHIDDFNRSMEKNHRITPSQGYAMDEYESATGLEDKQVRSSLWNPKTGDHFGNSIFDDDVVVGEYNFENNLGDIRAENEPWYAKIAAGVGKAAVLAGTTAAGTVGLLYGIGQGIYNKFDDNPDTGFVDGLWNNPINQALDAINNKAEEWMPNYYTSYEASHPFTLSANFLGDKIIKNLGFMVGAMYGGLPVSSAVGKLGILAVKAAKGKAIVNAEKLAEKASKMTNQLKEAGLRAGLSTEEIMANNAQKLAKKGLDVASRKAAYQSSLKTVQNLARTTKATTQLLGSIASAGVEGSIEAIGNSNEWAELEHQKLAEEDAAKRAEIVEKYGEGTPETLALLAEQDELFKAKSAAIEKEKINVGNADLLMNLPILTASNWIQFAKLYLRGFKATKKILGNSSKYSGSLEGADLASKKTWKGAVAAALKNSLAEGNEEYMQRAASEAAGNAASQSLENYISAKDNYESKWGFNEYINNFGKSLIDNSTNASALEEFTIGAISSMLGMPMFGKSHTDTAWLGKGKKFGLSGGLVGEVMDYMKEKEQETKVANYLNARVKDPNFKAMYEGLIAHHRFDQLMEEALKSGDKKGFKDAEFDQLFKDINALAQTGRLDEFKELIGYNKEYTDEELDDIVKTTTTTVTAEQQRAEDEQRLQMLQGELEISQAIRKEQKSIKAGKPGYTAAQDKADTLKSNNAELRKEISALQKKLNKNEYSDKQVGPFTRQDGTGLNNNEDGKKEMREILQKNRDSLLQAVDNFLAIREDVNTETNGSLSDEQIEVLSYLRAKIQNTEFRSFDIRQRLFKEESSMSELKKRYQQDITSAEERIKELEANPDTALHKKKTEAAKKRIEMSKQKIKILEQLENMDTEELQAALANPKNWMFFAQDLSNPLYALDRQKALATAQDLIDLTMLAQEKLAYNQKLNEFLQDPNKINEAYRNAQNQVSQEAINKQAEDLAANLSKAKTVQDINALLNDPNIDQRAIDKAFEKLESSEDEGLKEMLREYKGLRKTQSIFREILNRKEFPPQIANSILQSVQEIFNKAMTISDEELAKSYPDYKGRTDFVLGEMETLAQLYESNGQIELANNVREIIKDFNDSKKVAGSNKKSSQKTQAPDPKVEEEEKKKKPSTQNGGGTSQKEEKTKKKEKAKKSKEEKKEETTTTTESTEPQGTQTEEKLDVNKLSKDDVLNSIYNFLRKINGSSIEDLFKLLNNISSIYEQIPFLKEYNELHKDDGTKIGDDDIIGIIQLLIDDIEASEYTEINQALENSNDVEVDSRSAKMQLEQATTYTSGITKYNIYSTHREPYSPTDQLSQMVQSMLETYRAYNFVEKGFLGAIHQANNGNTEIFYLKSTTDGLNSVTFLAIEYDDKAAEVYRKNSSGPEDAEMHLITLDYNGKKKRFQIVGQLSVSSTATSEVQNSYNRLQGLLNDEFQEKKASGKFEGQPFIVSTKYKNKITSINTGRLDQSDTKQSLYSFMSESPQWKQGEDVSFGIVQNGRVVGTPKDAVPPNSTWVANNEGAIVLYVRKADGQVYPVRCTRRSVGEWLASSANATQTGRDMLTMWMDTGNSGNVYLNDIFVTIKTLISPASSLQQKIHAKYVLSKYFILGKNSPIQINTSGEVTLFGQPITSTTNVADFIEILAGQDVLFSLPSGKFIKDKTRAVVESGIMEIGLSNYDNFNPNFNIQVTDNDGNPSEVSSGAIENLGEKLSGKRNGVNRVTLGGVSYTVYIDIKEGTITNISYTDDATISVPQKERDAVTAFVYRNTCSSLADTLGDNVDKDAPEFKQLKNVLLLTNDKGYVIGIYDLNKPTRNRYQEASVMLPKTYKRQKNLALTKYFARKATENAWNWLRSKKSSKTQESIEQSTEQQESSEEGAIENIEAVNEESSPTQENVIVLNPTEETSSEQPTPSTEETTPKEEETPPVQNAETPKEEEKPKGNTEEPTGGARKSECLKNTQSVKDLQGANRKSPAYIMWKSILFQAPQKKYQKLAQQIFEDLQWMEENGYIDLNGKDLDTILDILNNPTTAKEEWDKFKTDKTCKG